VPAIQVIVPAAKTPPWPGTMFPSFVVSTVSVTTTFEAAAVPAFFTTIV
jgi:hypothetical protein